MGNVVIYDEYAKIPHRIFTYPKKVERNHVFADNNYYLCTEINNDAGTFEIVGYLSITGNEDIINELRKEYNERNPASIATSEGVADFISTIRFRGGWTDRDVPVVERESIADGTGVVDNVALQKESEQEPNNGNADRLGEEEGFVANTELDNLLSEKRDKIVKLLKSSRTSNWTAE